MRIVDPAYRILDELDRQSLVRRIEFCGRICYKSEQRIDDDSALPFVRNIVENGHNSVLEMGALSLLLCCSVPDVMAAFFACQPRYVQIDRLDVDRWLITGSVRAFRELALLHPEDAVSQEMALFLSTRHPYFFVSLLPDARPVSAAGLAISKLPLAEVEQLGGEQLARHRYLAVKFIVNRAVTHELVRHRPCSFLQESQRYCRYASDRFGNEVSFIRPLFFQEDSAEFAVWKKAMEEAEQHYLTLLQTASPQAARTVLPNSCKTEIIVYANLSEWRHILALRCSKAADPSMREVMLPLHEELCGRFPAVFS